MTDAAEDTEPQAPDADNVGLDVVPKRRKTPFFQATQALRYQRQALIKQIQDDLTDKTPLICYVAGDNAPIDRDDAVAFVDLLHNIKLDQSIDLLIHTPGGDINAAEKLITMTRKRVGTGRLRIFVPDYAKSAGTLMSVGGDVIVMSDSSELGPIDPQIEISDPQGNVVYTSMQTYLDAFTSYSEAVRRNPADAVAVMMLDKLDPSLAQHFKSIMSRAKRFAEEQLKLGMFKEVGNWSQAATDLIDTKKWQSHGQMISWESATSIGLNVEYRDPADDLWASIWQLYCLQRWEIGNNQKLFESDYVCLKMDASSG